MRNRLLNLRNLVLGDSAFAVTVLAAVAMAIGCQLVVAPAPEVTLTLLTLFVVTALIEFGSGQKR